MNGRLKPQHNQVTQTPLIEWRMSDRRKRWRWRERREGKGEKVRSGVTKKGGKEEVDGGKVESREERGKREVERRKRK